MVLVGNKCDLQAWAVDMSSAREVIESVNTENVTPLILIQKYFVFPHRLRWQNSTAYHLSRHQPRPEWASTMPSIR